MGITFGDYLIDSGYYDPEEEPMPVEDERTQAHFDERMERAEKRGYACEALSLAQQSVIAASIGSCDCNTKTNNPAYHMAYCRWLKLISALDHLDSVAGYLKESIVHPQGENMTNPPEHFWDFMEDGNFDKFVEKENHVCAKGHEWYVKPKMGPRIQQCRRCGAIDYGDNDLPLPRS